MQTVDGITSLLLSTSSYTALVEILISHFFIQTEMKSPGFDVQLCSKINEIPTEIVVQQFKNQLFIVISQYGKMGNLYSVKFDKVERNLTNPVQVGVGIPITISCNFGADTDEVRAGLTFLVNKTKLGEQQKEFLISFGLKEINGKILREVATVLEKCL